MGVGLDLLLDEYYHIEMNMSYLYTLFRNTFEEDGAFWWSLLEEEVNHAALITSIKNTFAPLGKYPSFIDHITFDKAFEENQLLRNTIASIKSKPISREKAFKIAYKVETSAMEQHYQEFMAQKETGNPSIDKIFQKLNNFDKDHATRIKAYAEENGLRLKI